MIAVADFHHSQLFQSLIYLFEMRLGIELYRPEGMQWYPDYYWHPLPAEAEANLTAGSGVKLRGPAIKKFSWLKDERPAYFDQDNLCFRWFSLDRAHEIDYLICTSDRNEQRFANLKRNLCPKAKVVRYVGNRSESVDTANWDIGIFATLKYYEQFKHSKPCVLFHPEFDLNLYSYTDPLPPTLHSPIIRSYLNFLWHHREANSPWELWNRWAGYANALGAMTILHGLGTPPPDVHVEMDVILDTCFDRMGRPDLKDRSKWPDLRWNQGEPGSHKQIADLMKCSNLAMHIKRGSEGYGYVIHALAACGRPPIIEEDAYRELSAFRFLQHRETCLYVTGNDTIDRENLRWALQPENNLRMAQTLHQRFCDNVSFEAEATAITKLL